MQTQIYLALDAIEESIRYTVSPLQQIVFSSLEFTKAELQREDTGLLLILHEQRKVVYLHNFFKGEKIGFFPTILLPTQESISGFGFVALLNPTLLQVDIHNKGGIYSSPKGTFMEYMSYTKDREEQQQWTISPILFSAPQSAIIPSVHVYYQEETKPDFYSTIEQYLANKPQYKEHAPKPTHHETQHNHTYIHEEEHIEDSYESPSYHSGYVFSEEAILAGYRVIAVNDDPSEVEQMVGGYYGYLTLASEGWFTYILGEGVYPEEDSYLEDMYQYTIQSPDNTTIDGTITIQTFYDNNALAYKAYHTEL